VESNHVSEEKQRYMSYLIRLWQTQSSGEWIWRASIENAHTGERRGFARLELLFQFLEEEAGGAACEVKPRAEPEQSKEPISTQLKQLASET